MTTGAMYLITADDLVDYKVCFYIYWDGDLEGAADYFGKMHQEKNHTSGYAGRFFRANEEAKLIKSHDDDEYGNTEYQYTLDNKSQLTARHRPTNSAQWKTIYQGNWYDLVNKYLKKKEKGCILHIITHREH